MNRAQYTYPTTNDKTVELELDPHYSDRRFYEEQTVFGSGDGAKHYQYSGRMAEWDYAKHKQAWAESGSAGLGKATAARIEDYLRRYYDNQTIVIRHIVSGVNLGNGYPYNVFGYSKQEDHEQTP